MVGLVDDYFKKFPINSRIKVYENYGTVKYIGEVKGYTGLWVGVEWDDPTRGKHDGMTNGTRYFQTEHPTAGSMIRPVKISKFQSLEESAKNRYLVKEEQNPLDEELIRETREHLQAAVFEIVGMDKIAKKQSHIDELTDVSVAYSCTNSSGDLSTFRRLSSLNLTATLIWNWNIVADICEQVPTLRHLNLSCNRLQLPSKKEIVELEPCFRHIKHINLRKCHLSNWQDIVTAAHLWPNIESLGLQENEIEEISNFDPNQIFLNLRELDLHLNKLSNFEEICKLGKIQSLNSLFLMNNGIEKIRLPFCEYDKRLSIFLSLEKLNLLNNPIGDECHVFNELDKLPSLNNLCISANPKTGYEEMFSRAVALIPKLETLCKVKILNEERRGAEYDIWKLYGAEWQQTENNPEARKQFYMKCRAYPKLIEKYGSPEEFLVRPAEKLSNLVKIRILNKLTGAVFEKKVPRKISVQTLQGLIIKQYKMENTMPKLSYNDANHPDLIVQLDNTAKNLDYYSIQDGDTVMVEW